jgi:hypothetical protein
MESYLLGRTALKSESPSSADPASEAFRPLMSPIEPQNAALQDTKSGSHSEPHVELVKGKDGIDRIIVTCSCGKRTEIQCTYE